MGEAEDFRLPGEPRRVLVTRDLLEELGVAGHPRGEQQVAVKAWLVTNEPHQVLALSLRADGFLDENVSNNLSNEQRRTGTGRRRTTGSRNPR
jgi:hypothetical protein